MLYLAVVFALDRRIVSGSAATSPATQASLLKIQQIHNLVLCLGSLAMLLGTLVELFRRSATEGGEFWWFVCEDVKTKSEGALWFWAYVYYLSKFYELLDTVIQMVKGRRPPSFFLHVYHHAVVLYMSWGWLEYRMSLMWGGLLFNTLVHTVMYYYYYLKACGVSPWWKRYVTSFQILQFATSAALGVLLFRDVVFGGAECAGLGFVCFNIVFNMTLMVQFAGLLVKGGAGRKKGQ